MGIWTSKNGGLYQEPTNGWCLIHQLKNMKSIENHHLKIYPKFGAMYKKKLGPPTRWLLGLLYQGLGPDAYGKMWYTNGNRLPGRSLCRFSHAFPPVNKSGKIHLRWLIYFWVAQPPSSHASSMNSYILAAYRTQLVRVSAWAAWLGCCPLVWHSVHRHIHFLWLNS